MSVFYSGAISAKFGVEAMQEITIDVWQKMAVPEMDVPRKAARIEGNDVETFAKLNHLAGSFPNGRDFYKYEYDVIDKNRAILTVHHCKACTMFGSRGLLDLWDWNCKVLEKEGMLAYIAQANPAMKVKELRAGRKDSPDEPACKWEFYIED